MTREELNEIIDALIALRDKATDAAASLAVRLYPTLKQSGELIHAGTRIRWDGALKIAAVDLWDTAENTPAAAPSLWRDISYRLGCRIIPDVITVTDAFSAGERGWWDDTLYESLQNNNVYTPAQYAAFWKEVANG